MTNMELHLPFGIRFVRGKTTEELSKGDVHSYIDFMVKSVISKGGEDDFEYIGVEPVGFKARQATYFQNRARVDDLYTIAFAVEAIRTSIMRLRDEVFRRGFEWEPVFTVKCMNDECGHEFEESIPKCPDCQAETREPDLGQRDRIDRFIERSNHFDQSLMDVLKECEEDVNVVDDAWLLLHSEYVWKQEGENIGQWLRKVLRIQRLDPASVEFDLDQDELPERKTAFCPNHRIIALGPDDEFCPECESPTMMAMYKYNRKNETFYFARIDMVHWSKFSPSKTYGFSPVLTLMSEALTTIGMKRFMYDLFYERKLPKQVITTITDDPTGLQAEIKKLERRMQKDPAYSPWIAISGRRSTGKTESVKLQYTPEELEYASVSKSFRGPVSAMWGVSNIWLGEVEGAGGLTKESQQMLVTSRAVEASQDIYNDKVLPRICQAFGITDWNLVLLPPEETTEDVELALEERRVTIATMMYNLGYDVNLKPDGTFQYEKTTQGRPTEQTIQQSIVDLENRDLDLRKALVDSEDRFSQVLVIVGQLAGKMDDLDKRSKVGVPMVPRGKEPKESVSQVGVAERVGTRFRKPTEEDEPPVEVQREPVEPDDEPEEDGSESFQPGYHRHPIIGHPTANSRWHPIERSHRTVRHDQIDPKDIEARNW